MQPLPLARLPHRSPLHDTRHRRSRCLRRAPTLGGIRRRVDTRNKILISNNEPPWPEFDRPLAVVTGYFDVLRAEHVRELQHARDAAGAAMLLVMVLPNPAAVLSQRARAELVAALRIVDRVLMTDAAVVDPLLALLHPAHLVRLEEADERRVQQLREHVRKRSRYA